MLIAYDNFEEYRSVTMTVFEMVFKGRRRRMLRRHITHDSGMSGPLLPLSFEIACRILSEKRMTMPYHEFLPYMHDIVMSFIQIIEKTQARK